MDGMLMLPLSSVICRSRMNRASVGLPGSAKACRAGRRARPSRACGSSRRPERCCSPPIEADRASARVEVRMGMQHADYRERVLVDVGLTAESELDGSSSSHLA